nr:zinc finger, CCHC-type [Tanacetum cinerariifolium]
MLASLNSMELQKMTKAKDDGGEGLYNHKKSQGFVKNENQISDTRADGYESADVMMAISVEELLDWVMDSGGSFHITYMRDYLVDFEEYDDGNALLGDGRECRVHRTSKRSTQKCMKSGVAKHLDVAGIQQQNELVEETNMTLLAKFGDEVRCDKGLGIDLTKELEMLRLDDVTSKVVLYRNMGFNESEKYMKTFIGSGVAGSQEVQTQDFIYYHLARDREQHTTYEIFSYREDSNEAAFAVAEAKRIYAHESLTSNNAIVRDQSGNTLRVSHSRFYNGKLVQTLLEGHSILSLEGSLSEDCDVEKNASTDVAMLDKFDRGLKTDVQVFVDFEYTMGRSITADHFHGGVYDTYEGCKGGYLAKGTRNGVRIRAKDSSGYCYMCLVKGYPWSEVLT